MKRQQGVSRWHREFRGGLSNFSGMKRIGACLYINFEAIFFIKILPHLLPPLPLSLPPSLSFPLSLSFLSLSFSRDGIIIIFPPDDSLSLSFSLLPFSSLPLPLPLPFSPFFLLLSLFFLFLSPLAFPLSFSPFLVLPLSLLPSLLPSFPPSLPPSLPLLIRKRRYVNVGIVHHSVERRSFFIFRN